MNQRKHDRKKVGFHLFTVVFDVDDTLYDQFIPFEQAYDQVFGDKYGIPVKELYYYRQEYSHQVFYQSQRGEMSMEDMYIYRMGKAFQVFDVQIKPQKLLEFQKAYEYFQDNISIDPEVVKVLDYLSARDVQMAVLTNGPEKHQMKKIQRLNLEKWITPDYFFISGALDLAKPQLEIFQLVEERVQAKGERFLMIGDSYKNDVVGAKQADWEVIFLNKYREALVGDIKPDIEIYETAELLETIESYK
ncbi:HAD family hydrolase [Vagococcus elongatus]|uniref:HAD family hydrolase n=1 Tax=Vagococcus elongatus TaxID=180344 RepID=A0A430ALJ6_9ENTE|nr:HAD family hydrolase [Vagococcus elongatus]RSU08854.1 hypothetical protein CBF29_13095 [Vagococcus elongatus]